MNSCRTFVLSIVALFAVVSLSAHGEQMAAAANNQGAGAVVDESAERHFGGLDKFDSGTRWPSFTTQGGGR